MNKFLPLTGGHSLKLNEFNLMQNAYLEGFKALVNKFSSNGNMKIDGVIIDTTGVNVIYTSGYVSINSEIYKVEAGTFPKSSDPADVLYFKIVENIFPPSPITYEDTVPKDVHFERKVVLKYKEVTDTDGIEVSNMSYPGAVIEGSIIPWYPPLGKLVTDYFDTTGLGINSAFGYAICNGLNNTLDLRGMFLAMATNVPFAGGSAPLNTILNGITANAGTEGGNNLVILNQSQIPDSALNLSLTDPTHTHFVVRSQTVGGNSSTPINSSPNGTIPGRWATDNNDEYDLQGNGTSPANAGKTSPTATGITVSGTVNGGGLSHENRPATKYLYYITKIRV